MDSSKKFLDIVTQNLPGTFYVFNSQGKMVEWNKNVEEISGYSHNEIKDLNPLDFFAADEQTKINKAVQTGFLEGKVEVEADFFTKNGERIPFYFNATKTEIDGNPHLVGIGIDISKQKAAHQEVKKQRKLLGAIMEQSGSIIFVKNVGGKYRLVNQKFCELFGTDEAEIYNSTDWELLGKKEAEIIVEEDRAILKSGNPKTFEESVQIKGELKHFLTTKYPLKDIDGFENSICGITNDITAQKNAEKELEVLYKKEKEQRIRSEEINHRLKLLSQINTIFLEQEGNLETALSKVSDLLVERVSDSCSFDILTNEGFQRIVMNHRDQEKKIIWEQIQRDYPEMFYGSKFIRRVLAERDQVFIKKVNKKILDEHINDRELYRLVEKLEMESILIKPLLVREREVGVMTLLLSGSQTEMIEDSTFLFDEIAYKIALSIDRFLVNEELRNLNQTLDQKVTERTHQLETANKELESFSYSVSHDLRSPLRAIGGYSKLLLEDHYEDLNSEGREFLTIVREETERMGELIDDLLAFSRLNRQEQNLQLFSMTNLVQECVKEIKTAYPELYANILVEELPEVKADRSLIKQVWLNLIGNSVKFRKPGQEPEIKIYSQMDKEQYQTTFKITDNGVGFDMKYADKLFGVFQRLHSTEEFEGTGIGLALAQRIVRRHGGNIWAESEPDKGTTISFTLPTPKIF